MLSSSEEERDFCKYDDVVVMAIDHFVDKDDLDRFLQLTPYSMQQPSFLETMSKCNLSVIFIRRPMWQRLLTLVLK